MLYCNTANPNVPSSNCIILKQNQCRKKHTSLGTNSSNPLTDSKTKLFILRFFLFLPDLVNCQNPFWVALKGARCLSSLAKTSCSWTTSKLFWSFKNSFSLRSLLISASYTSTRGKCVEYEFGEGVNLNFENVLFAQVIVDLWFCFHVLVFACRPQL